MFERRPHEVVWFLPIPEIQGDVLEQMGLVAFDGEVVVRLSVLNQVVGELALCQQRVGRDFLALDVDGVQQRDGGFDFVGAFELLIAVYRQGTDFFWV